MTRNLEEWLYRVMDDRETLTAGVDPIADEVRAFYDSHPYPPPVEDLDSYHQRWQDEGRRRADYHLFWPGVAYHADLTVLVAGCGTSQAAKYALRQPKARLIGIDVSETSIRHTQELKRKYNLENLEVHQLPLERVSELGHSFDKIVCTGVLHHLPDPDAGLRALRQVLKQDGAMHIMVYATYGRMGIYMLQEYCRRLGIGTSDEEIQDLATTLMALPQDHPLAQLLGAALDFRRKSALADALLHPQDRAYTVPQLFDFIEQNGLKLGRWIKQAPYLPQCGELANTPHYSRLTKLPTQEQYAAVELLRGTMVRHSAVLYRDDRPGDVQQICFDGEGWQDYIPIRLPATIRVQKDLPPGAAAVLINQDHTYPDLYLPIGVNEDKIFRAIDGRRTIAEIINLTSTPGSRRQQNEQIRTLFERFWWYDQVVFDASRHS